MKKKCMAVGGTAKKPASMEEQLAGIRGKVRTGYQAGGIAGIDYPRSFSGQFPARQPLGAGLGATAIQSGEYAVNAPGSTPQSLGLLGSPDYSTGPKQGGFVYEDGTPRPSQDDNEETQSAKRGPLSGQIDMGQAMAGLSNTERYKLGGSGTSAEVSEINQRNDILKTLNASLQPTQQIQVGRAPRPGIVGGIEEQLIKRGRNGFADGGIIDKLIRTVGRVLPASNGQKYEPGIQSRAAEDPARHGRAEALNPRTQTTSSETPPAGGFQEEAARRRKQMEDAKNYESGGMVRFAGKGGPRDDQIPVKVAGQEINVSNGENAVILPAKTAANPAALYAIGGIIQATNDGRKPKMGMENGGAYKDGVYPYDDKRPPTAQEVYAPTYAVPGSIIGALPEGGYLRTPEGRAQVMEALSGKGLRPDVGILGPRNAASVAPTQSTYPSASAQATSQEQPYSREGRPSALGQAYQSYKPQAQGIAAGVANADARMQNVAANDGMTTTQMGRGFDPTKLQMAPGYGMASNAAGKTISVGPSEYVGADGQATSRWTDTQQYKDAIARNQADKLRLAEMQSQRLGADPMAVQKASQGIVGGVLDARTQEAVLQRNAQIQSLVAKAAAEPDQGKRQQFIDAALAMQGKDNKQEKNLQVVDLGSESAPDGMGGVKAIPRGQELYDANTKQWVPRPSGSAPQGDITGTAEANKIKADYQAKKITKEQANAALAKLEGR